MNEKRKRKLNRNTKYERKKEKLKLNYYTNTCKRNRKNSKVLLKKHERRRKILSRSGLGMYQHQNFGVLGFEYSFGFRVSGSFGFRCFVFWISFGFGCLGFWVSFGFGCLGFWVVLGFVLGFGFQFFP